MNQPPAIFQCPKCSRLCDSTGRRFGALELVQRSDEYLRDDLKLVVCRQCGGPVVSSPSSVVNEGRQQLPESDRE